MKCMKCCLTLFLFFGASGPVAGDAVAAYAKVASGAKVAPGDTAAPDAKVTSGDKVASDDVASPDGDHQFLRETQRELSKKWEAVRSFTAKTETVIASDRWGRTLNKTTSGTIAFLRRDGHPWLRLDLTTSEFFKFKATEKSNRQTMKSVSDGRVVTTVAWRSDGGIVAYRVKHAPLDADLGGEALFDALGEHHALTLMPSEAVGGRGAYVIRAVPIMPEKNISDAYYHYFDIETGIRIKLVGMDKEGKVEFVSTLDDLKLNVDIDVKLFELEVPEEARLRDLTGDQSPADQSEAPKP